MVTGDEPAASVGERVVSPPKSPVVVPPVLDKATTSNVSIRVNLQTQRLHLLVAGELAIDSPVSTGRRNLETPVGKFHIVRKDADPKPDSYGKFVDAKGKVIVAGVYLWRDPVPRGLRYEPVARRHQFRFKDQEFSLHAGRVSSLPISDGAVIVPPEIARLLFAKVPVGNLVEVIEK